MDAYRIASWAGFLAAAASVSATLTGLIFVAVSINLGRILEFPGLPDRAAEPILELSGALIISLISLVPGQSTVLLGVELTVAGLILWILQTRLQRRSRGARPEDQEASQRPIASIVLSQLATLPFIFAGISVATGVLGGLYWLVPGLIFSMVAGVSSAWVLLVEILR